jgi:hypothetical protein
VSQQKVIDALSCIAFACLNVANAHMLRGRIDRGWRLKPSVASFCDWILPHAELIQTKPL